MNNRFGSRKFLLGVILLMLGTAFGVYCVAKGADLMAAGAYWGSVSLGAGAYMHYNTREKAVGGNGGASSSANGG